MSSILTEKIEELSKLNDTIIQVGIDLITCYESLYVFDIFLTAILNRTLNVNRGFISEIQSNNFICAAPLVRIQLDSYLRLYASTLINYDVDEFAQKIINGESIRNLKDSKGIKMTDKYLVDEISTKRDFAWVKYIYNAANGFIHLSDKHILASSRVEEGTRKIESIIRKDDEFIPIKEKEGAVEYQTLITQNIIQFVNSWIQQKKGYGMRQP